ncbi:hypothetical protein GCM10010168_39790 [Actinoplanes ianthinogenes]|uniref:Uncharacterized protein n=1 Tax=Actinoplanes ianthinogenes TaxID=122358 RepID=A0ABN6CDZ5_9ACTN|nr:hypothetical protein [Actinoplanes ianthinogenes]BCJ43712.1 hypothetical protein Aiant_43690 [Actinoplanes ianthinogenes]GGR18142.1 hypothetical protein GCM10010168_39790 [Actinoplanes ianthinogenes]
MPAPQNAFEAVLHAARDVPRLSCALEAEMLGTALLGSVYAVADGDRAAAVREFVGEFLTATGQRPEPAATILREVFAALVPDAAGAAEVRHDPQGPSWAGQLGRVRATGCHAYGDVYGDQTSYLVTFAYEEEDEGGPEHAVVTLVDHNIGIVRDVFVAESAERILTQVRALCEHDDLTWFRDEDPGLLRDEVDRHLRVTDELGDLPADGSLATDRALAAARLALLPAPTTPPLSEPAGRNVPELIRNFLASPEAARAGLAAPDADQPSLQFCLGLLMDHASTLPGADPLRWSPAVAGLFLLDWVHRRAVLDMDDAAMLPRVVRAWSEYATWRRGLPPAAIAETAAEVEKLVPEFVRLYSTGERRSPATAAVAQLIAEGVDPNDPDAIDAWLQANRDRLTDD